MAGQVQAESGVEVLIRCAVQLTIAEQLSVVSDHTPLVLPRPALSPAP